MTEILAKHGPAALDIAASLLVLLLSWVLMNARSYLLAKTKNENLQTAITKIDDLVDTFVKAIDQTMVADLKDALKDGKFTPEEAAKAKAKVFELVLLNLGHLGGIAKDLGHKEAERVKALVDAKIEAKVAELRSQQQVEAAVAQSIRPPAPSEGGEVVQ